ncbi:MAG: hypothetical protein AMQ22_02265 [Candidatus Methanofastidiosum methylothiophilum]|uniref:Uncharacterized protein n=1 Tax=Candidatus Methanofastidiosum methylothiophilum TaxID=1705564 RepID=A0A150IIM8_9EURY|nr:MAG: hypothetical protein AMQ22_02265 [Candidatus Methanofastidiosum methylthiophilus]
MPLIVALAGAIGGWFINNGMNQFQQSFNQNAILIIAIVGGIVLLQLM